MSRVGKEPITVPAGVTVDIDGSRVTVKGKLGELTREFQRGMTISLEDGFVKVERGDDSREQRSFHGLTRTLIKNMIEGVATGYKRGLVIDGTGFKAELQGQNLSLSLGFASPKIYPIPEGISIVVDPAGVKLSVEGVNKELVGEVAARIRHHYPAEPYKGKGIRYADEQIRRKQGKTVA